MTRKTDDLNARELAFCRFYVDLGAVTCGNASASAKAAGYAKGHTQPWRLMMRPVIKAKICELHEAVMDRHLLNPSKILHDLENTRSRALEKGDLSVATRCSELQGKYFSMFNMGSSVPETEDRERELTATARVEARRLSLMLMREANEKQGVGS